MHSFEKYETFVFYYNPESEIDKFIQKFVDSDEKCLSIGHFVYDQNNGKLNWFEYNIYNYGT